MDGLLRGPISAEDIREFARDNWDEFAEMLGDVLAEMNRPDNSGGCLALVRLQWVRRIRKQSIPALDLNGRLFRKLCEIGIAFGRR